MKKLSSSITIVFLTLAAFSVQFFFAPTSASAAYRSHYDDLPGEEGLPWVTIIAVGVAAALTIVLISHATKGKKDQKNEIEKQQDQQKQNHDTDSTSVKPDSTSEKTSIYLPKCGDNASFGLNKLESPYLSMYINLNGEDNEMMPAELSYDLNSVKLKVGLSYHF
ncbi:MAG: hypothetical protein NT002_02765 [candidate division Zixibacteria bacterium]|nr:hypothetical protein [candidate division Zixibacteria bacterium]